jgi:hypothetical protein
MYTIYIPESCMSTLRAYNAYTIQPYSDFTVCVTFSDQQQYNDYCCLFADILLTKSELN